MKKTKIGVFDIILLLFSLMLCAGSVTFFKACGPMEDGSWMNCHWANVTVTALSSVLAVIALAVLLIRNRTLKAVLSLMAVPVSIFTAFVPGSIISLCMMPEMHCRAYLQPATILLSVLITVAAAVNGAVQLVKKGKEK